jgi:protein-disulfide isomerase
VTAFAGKVRWFPRLPPALPRQGQEGRRGGHCADEQGRFWQMHDWMFDHQDKLDVADLKEGAKGLGLDSARFDECLDSGKFAKRVEDNMSDGQKAGVGGTPAFFVNGKLISGAQPFETFKSAIEAELEK